MIEKLQQVGERLVKLRTMLRARTDSKGKAVPGYEKNVPEIQAEIERLEAFTLPDQPTYDL